MCDSCSGGTPEFPSLIKYTCDLITNVRVVSPAMVTVPDVDKEVTGSSIRKGGHGGASIKGGKELMSTVLGGRPVLALAFDDMVVRAYWYR